MNAFMTWMLVALLMDGSVRQIPMPTNAKCQQAKAYVAAKVGSHGRYKAFCIEVGQGT